ncbi:MAG: cation:proton antiporter [Pseudomonadota bacterium]
MELSLIIIAAFAVCFAMVAKRIANTIFTAPMIFIAFGFALSQAALFPKHEAERILHLVAEVALILLLFLDAAQINSTALYKRHVWPVRMLVIGLPLSILIGTLVAWLFLPAWPLVMLALIASILAPTDAALGQAVVTNAMVPERSRRALTVESGLNDGLALPAVLLFASLTAEVSEQESTNWLLFGVKQVLLGPLAGAIIGVIGGYVLIWAKDRDLTADTYEGVGAIALAGLTYLAAGEIGGNGFIAAFIAGLCFGHVVDGRCKFIFEFTESEGLLLTWGAFFLLGLALLPDALSHLSWPMVAVILTSLLIVRPLAIWVSLIGTDASPATRLFFGWFGPRGLATALFALLIVSDIDHDLAEPILALAINAVWISALLHGMSALPGARWYSRQKTTTSGEDEDE